MKTALDQHQPGIYDVPRYTISLIKEAASPFHAKTRCQSSEDVYRYFKDICENQDREHLYALFLDTKHVPIGMNHVAMGTLSTTIVHPREVFKCAILLNAACLLIVHNHPSGDPSPSPEDRALTTRIAEAGQLLGIALLDHVVIGNGRYFSFADHGPLTQQAPTYTS